MDSDLAQTRGGLDRQKWLFLHYRCLHCDKEGSASLMDSRGDTPTQHVADFAGRFCCQACREAGRADRDIEFSLSRPGPNSPHWERLAVEFIGRTLVSRGRD